jgi:hypothetical protein
VHVRIVSDGAGGAVVAWQANTGLFAQHVLASAMLDPAYGDTGRVVSSLPTQAGGSELVATGAGGAIVAWQDTRSGFGLDLYAMQVLETVTTGVPAPDPPAIAFRRPGPNPARGATLFRFSLPSETSVRLAVYDASGRRVRELVSGARPAGEHAIGWDLRDARGVPVGAGIYFARLEVGGRTLTQKLITLK